MGKGSERGAAGHALSKLGVISGPRKQDLGRGLSALKSQAVGEGSKKGARGHSVRMLGVISGPIEEDWGSGVECIKVTSSGRGEREGGWRARCEEARSDLGAERARLGGGT